MAADQLSRVFSALADPTRRDMVARLAVGDATVNELAEPYDVTVQAVSKHLKVLPGRGARQPHPRRAAPAVPPRHEVERLGLQMGAGQAAYASTMNRASPASCEHPEVLRDRLESHVVRRGQLAHRGVAHREPGDDVAPGRVGERGERPREPVRCHL